MLRHQKNWVSNWSIGNTLSIVASDDILDDLVDLSLDPNQGRAREMIVEAWGPIRRSRSIKTLAQCLKDEQVAGHAVVALSIIRSVEALGLLEPFLHHPKPWIREAARAPEKGSINRFVD